MNYKEIDREKVKNYIASKGGECSVKDIMKESGAEQLRVYALLFEEKLAGHIEYVKASALGAPEIVKLV